MKPDMFVDYMQADIDGVITVETAKLPDGTKVSGHVVVADHDAEPAVARILEVGRDRTVIRILPGSAEDNADLLERRSPTFTA